MHASFWAIYKRSRFSERGLSDEERMQQRERFGAACFALCLQHDEDFCLKFVRKICDIRSPRRPWRVDVDRYHWADILLQADDFSIVVECKIRDDLKEKQDPWNKRGKFTTPKAGYGWCFQQEPLHGDRTYVVLTETREEREKTLLGIRCLTATWTDIRALSRLSRTRGWVKDLFFSLANLEYPAFRSMKGENLYITDVEETINCHQVLKSVGERLGLAGPKIEHQANIEDQPGLITDGSIGVEIIAFKNTPRASADIRKMIQPPYKYLAWFGYEFARSHKPTTRLSVWFYCGNAAAAKRVKKCIGSIKGWRCRPPKDLPALERHSLRFSRSAERDKGDGEKFLSLLRRIIPEIHLP
jgi:hypothetical protein